MKVEDIQAICNLIKDVVSKEGACGVRWAINEHFKRNSMQKPAAHEREKIAAMIALDRKYVVTVTTDDGYYITLNPSYELTQEVHELSRKQTEFAGKASKYAGFTVVITLVNAVFVLGTVLQTCNSKTDKQLHELTKEIKSLSYSNKQIQSSINDLNITISTFCKGTDTTKNIHKTLRQMSGK